MTRVVVFDVNETLLDLSALREPFAELVGTADRLGEWFARLLQGSLVANEIGRYRSFGEIGVDALVALCRRSGIAAGRDEAAAVVDRMRTLPPHPDVVAGMTALRDAGFRLAVLTNGSTEVMTAQLANAGLAGLVERALSVDDVRRFKPAPAVYLNATALLGVEIDEALMVAAHDWDLMGARSVGMPGAFVARPGAVWGFREPLPDIVVDDIAGLADHLIASYR